MNSIELLSSTYLSKITGIAEHIVDELFQPNDKFRIGLRQYIILHKRKQEGKTMFACQIEELNKEAQNV